jgi:hypothetical protein
MTFGQKKGAKPKFEQTNNDIVATISQSGWAQLVCSAVQCSAVQRARGGSELIVITAVKLIMGR